MKRKSVKPRSGLLCTGRIKTEDSQNILHESSPPKLHPEFSGRKPPTVSSILPTNVNTGETRHSEGTKHTTKTEVAKLSADVASSDAEERRGVEKNFQRLDEKLNASHQSVMRRATPKRTSALPSLSTTALNSTMGSDRNRSQWHGCSSPGKLNTSKLIVKSNLVRPELSGKSTISQKLQSQFKVRIGVSLFLTID